MTSGMGRACSLLCLVAYKRQKKAISRVERETIMGDVYTCTFRYFDPPINKERRPPWKHAFLPLYFSLDSSSSKARNLKGPIVAWQGYRL